MSAEDWTRESCGACVAGLVSDYSGGDFNGPKDCGHCGGQGYVFRSPQHRLALWPGGPFVGFDPPAGDNAERQGERLPASGTKEQPENPSGGSET